MIDREHELPLKRQAELLQLSREAPFAGSRMLRDLLCTHPIQWFMASR